MRVSLESSVALSLAILALGFGLLIMAPHASSSTSAARPVPLTFTNQPLAANAMAGSQIAYVSQVSFR